LEREAAREQRSEREKESALELAIEQNRFSLHRQQQEHMAGLNRELWVSNIKTTFSGIKDVMNDKKGLATVGSAVVGVVSAITGIYFTAKYGIPKLFAKKKPRIVNETSLPENIQEWLFGKTIPASRHSEMVYSNDLEDNIFHLIESFKKAIRMKRPISNLLFWGMPGTGKSMAAKEIARHSGAEYIGMSGADLFQLPIEEALQELKNLHQFSKKSKKPVIIFVDEAEAIFPSRENASENTQKITDSFLGLIDKPSDQKVAWIFATNHPKKIDTAVLSRVSKRGIIHFTLPDFDARVKLITLYMNKTFIAPYAASCELKNGLSLIAAKTENWSGRDIEQLMIDTLAEADQMQSAEATLEDVFRVISRFDANQF
jgi:ATPase family AAA domain-containing protein 3A/B